jgi:hypothetical protein
MNLPPSADVLRKQIEIAKDRNLEKVRKAATGTIERFNVHISELIANPEKFTYHTLYSEEMPLWAYHKNSYNDYLSILQKTLNPLGYVVEQRHDGGGMYSTVVIRWNI